MQFHWLTCDIKMIDSSYLVTHYMNSRLFHIDCLGHVIKHELKFLVEKDKNEICMIVCLYIYNKNSTEVNVATALGKIT